MTVKAEKIRAFIDSVKYLILQIDEDTDLVFYEGQIEAYANVKQALAELEGDSK